MLAAEKTFDEYQDANLILIKIIMEQQVVQFSKNGPCNTNARIKGSLSAN